MDEETAVETATPSLSERLMAYAGNPNSQHMPVATPDAAASEDEAADADQQGNQGEDDPTDDGLDTDSDEEGSDADQGEEGEDDADESDQKGEEGKGTKKRTLEERAAEIAAKIVEQKLNERDKTREAEKPDFAPPEMVRTVKLNIIKAQAQARELEMEIEADGDAADDAKIDELLRLHGYVADARAALKEDEQKRQAWQEKQKTKQTTDTTIEAARRDFDRVAELYRQEVKVEPETWKKMGDWFTSQANSKPLVAAEFNEVVERGGKVAGIRWAYEYTTKHMGQQSKAATAKKEQSKTKTAALTAQTTGKVAPIDLAKARQEFAANPTPEAFAKFQELKRRAKG